MLDLRPLLLARARADAIDVFGTKLGGPAAALRNVPGLQAEPSFEQVLQAGGWLRVDKVSIRVENGLIARVFVRGAALDALGIRRERHILKRFGEPAGHQVELGRRIAMYPERDFGVAWHQREGRLEHVVLGGVTGWVEPRLGARELLDLLLNSWAGFEQHGFRKPPRELEYLRHAWLQADALCRALELGHVVDVARGAFLAREDHGRYQPACERLRAASRLPAPIIATLGGLGTSSLDIAYHKLLSFRRRAQELLRFNAGVLACSDALLIGVIRMTNTAAEPLRAAVEPIDAILLELLDPERRSFARRELVERFGFSDVDLGEFLD